MQTSISRIIQHLNRLLNTQIDAKTLSFEFYKISENLKHNNLRIIIVNVDISVFYYDTQLKQIIANKNEAIRQQKFEYAALLRDKEKQLAMLSDSVKVTEASHFYWQENCIVYKANIYNPNEILLVDLVKKFQTSYYT